MISYFTKHPHSINETYFKHFCFSLSFGAQMCIGGLACAIHAIFPFLFQKTGSDFLLKLTSGYIDRMPKLEDRVIRISDCIDKKMSKSA